MCLLCDTIKTALQTAGLRLTYLYSVRASSIIFLLMNIHSRQSQTRGVIRLTLVFIGLALVFGALYLLTPIDPKFIG